MGTKELQSIAQTLTEIAKPGMTAKQLMNAARKLHPKASKRDIVRGAFYAVIADADGNPDRAKQLHNFAMGERA